jgi:hypothetical protein
VRARVRPEIAARTSQCLRIMILISYVMRPTPRPLGCCQVGEA